MTKNQHEESDDPTSICWSTVAPELTSWWAADEGTRLAIWPSPVDHDACFSAAGFTEFMDSTDRRDDAIEGMTSSLLTELSRLGEPNQREGEVPLRGNTRTATLTDIVISPMTDDNFLPCVIGFGHGPAAMLCTSDGHEIWWVYLSGGVSDQAPRVLETLAGGRPIRRVDIDLSHLAPRPRHAV